LISRIIHDGLQAALGLIGRLERVVTFTAFIVLMAVVFADVASRELAGTGLQWARQAGVYANLFVILFGMGLASAGGTHLRPRFADNWLPAGWSGTLDRLQDGLMALFCLGFAVVAIGMVHEGYVLAERSAELGILTWPFQAVIPVAFTLAAFRHAVYARYPDLRPEPAQAPVVARPGGDEGAG